MRELTISTPPPGEELAQQLVPVDSYAAQPLPQAFANLEIMVPLLQSRGVDTFDVTTFYSRKKSGLTDEAIEILTEFDLHAVAAAQRIGGLLLYYRGETLDEPRANPGLGLDFVPTCLSFCIWESRQQAQRGADTPGHRAAAKQAALWYEAFGLKKYDLRLDAAESTLLFTEVEH